MEPDHRAGPRGVAGSHQNDRHQWRRVYERELRAPYENPTPLSNFVETLMIFLIPAGLTYTFGKMVGD